MGLFTRKSFKDKTHAKVDPAADEAPARVQPQKLPKLALEGLMWKVENFNNDSEEKKIEGCNIRQKIQINSCNGLSLHIGGKANTIIIDDCKDCRICVESVIGSVELVDCVRVKLQVTGSLPCVSIDKSQKVDIFVSESGKGVEITSSKSTEMNLNYPTANGDGEWIEVVIPEQFQHKLGDDGKLNTRVSDLYSC